MGSELGREIRVGIQDSPRSTAKLRNSFVHDESIRALTE